LPLAGAELCGRSSVAITLWGPDVGTDVAPQHREIIEEACRERAAEDTKAAAVGLVGLTGVTVAGAVAVRRRLRARMPTPESSPA